MPNWFYFEVQAHGTKEEINSFVENVKGSEKFDTEGREFDFNHFIPQPENIFRDNLSDDKRKELDELGIPNWYEWNNRNWGTKWNAVCDDFEIVGIDGVSNFVSYRLRTAWSDPRPVLHRMIEMYPNLNFIITGEEESGAYGLYIDSENEIEEEEEPILIDDENGREVYFDNKNSLWFYTDDNTEVEDQDDFWPINKYSWY
jgi:hypothetical protein